MDYWRTELTKNAFGGTELQMIWLHENLPEEFLKDYQIIPSRLPEKLDETKWRVLWCHDLAEDPANKHLDSDGWRKFHRIVFVSHFQKEQFLKLYNIPPSKVVVLQNAIYPISDHIKSTKINLVYHTTPHRGLEILVPVFEKLYEKYKDINLHVFSSFGIYGWKERDKPFLSLFERINNHPAMEYHEAVKNAEIREFLKNCHIFAYPSIWPETSCICLMEAMSAGLICVHPNFAALPETAANWTAMYSWHEDKNKHAGIFYQALEQAIQIVKDEDMKVRLEAQKSYADTFYSWDLRKIQWLSFLESLRDEPKEIPRGPVFVYKTS